MSSPERPDYNEEAYEPLPAQDAPASGEAPVPQAAAEDPEDTFDYVVPKETYHQHMKRRRRSTRPGNTKIASKEELGDATEGYIFTTPDKRKRHKSGHHRHSRWRRMPLWLRIIIVFVSVILALVIAAGATLLILNEIGRRAMHSYEDIAMVSPTEKSGDEIADIQDSGRTIVYDGKTYRFNDDIMSVTFIGTDDGTEEDEGLNMSDAIYVLTVDAKSGKVVILGVSRDTMTYVNLYSAEGKFIDTERMQIAYSYAYSGGDVTGGANTVTAVSRMFFGLPLKNYFAINLNALTTLNDTIGGVTLTSSMTFVSPIDGRTINEGETVTLHGKEAERYVRSRDFDRLDANNDRMKRQVEYIEAFAAAIIPTARKDISVIGDLYNEIQVNSDTNLDLPKMTYIASTALSKVRQASDIEFVNLTGKITAGEHAEMNLDDDTVIRTMLDIFYNDVE